MESIIFGKKNIKKVLIRLIFVSTIVVSADQISKYFVKTKILLYDNIDIIDNFFSLTHILNPGGAFGLFASQSSEIRFFIFLFLSSIISLLILWFYIKVAFDYVFLSYGMALIFGGAVGNLIDRFSYGYVIDFLDFYFHDLHFPAFNIADSAISIGMAILIYHILFNKIPNF